MRLPRAVNFSMGAVGAAMAATLAGRGGALSHHTSIVLDPLRSMLPVKPEDPRTKKRNKAQRAARKARRRGERR